METKKIDPINNLVLPSNDDKTVFKKELPHSTIESASCCYLVEIISCIWNAFTTILGYLFCCCCCPAEKKEENPLKEEAPVVVEKPVEEKRKEENPPLPAAPTANPTPITSTEPFVFAVPAPKIKKPLHIQTVIDLSPNAQAVQRRLQGNEESPRTQALTTRRHRTKLLENIKAIFSRSNVFEKSEKKKRFSLTSFESSEKKTSVREVVLEKARRGSFSTEKEIDATVKDRKTENTLLHYFVKSEGTEEFSDCGFTCTAEHIKLIVREYFATGGNVNLQNKFGWFPLHYSQSLETTQFLLNKMLQQNLEKLRNNFGQTLIHTIKDAKSVNDLIGGKAELANITDSENNTPLHAFAFLNHAKAEVLIEAGAQIDAVNKEGQTPLCRVILMARTNENLLEVAKLLIAKGANLQQRVGDSEQTIAQLIEERGYQDLLKS